MTDKVLIKVENTYTDGHESEKEVLVDAPASAKPEDVETWWEDVAFNETGDGHYVEVYEATGERLGTFYEVTIVEVPEHLNAAMKGETLVGQSREWVD